MRACGDVVSRSTSKISRNVTVHIGLGSAIFKVMFVSKKFLSNGISKYTIQYLCPILSSTEIRFARYEVLTEISNEGFYLMQYNAVSSVEISMDYKALYSRRKNPYDIAIIYNVPEIGFTLVSG
jgi:hypothetical protein